MTTVNEITHSLLSMIYRMVAARTTGSTVMDEPIRLRTTDEILDLMTTNPEYFTDLSDQEYDAYLHEMCFDAPGG